MIDMHCHLLPGVDDGAMTMEESIEMARIAAADGITDIVATPHTYNGLHQISGEKILESVKLLQTELDARNISIRIHPGSEIHLHKDLLFHLEQNHCMTYCNAKKYILLELPSHEIPAEFDQQIDKLKKLKLTPIIAHPERNMVLRKRPDILQNWIEHGVISQLTARSITGQSGGLMQRTAVEFIKNRFVHVIGSDAHNCSGKRPELRSAFEKLAELFSKKETDRFHSNAMAVINGENIQV
ncbi:tyrosine-protein phosphatase [Effusibacillus dendaii]|uniref:Tyrosine-protein phosphatase n=1 Tax=Effusibacillus dendaii TaxID=2743772 RepID=A0A7I8DDF4_9BACL|nr:CpsB/CapC family capsule biosynthesis tyrosine phosphatase [Effusibacillus dendaii]BCJ88154.1 tyrosine protein phosphatase [Effusibacillus dendaii]